MLNVPNRTCTDDYVRETDISLSETVIDRSTGDKKVHISKKPNRKISCLTTLC